MSAFVVMGRGLATGLAVLLAVASVNDLSAPVMASLGVIDVSPAYLGGAILAGLLFGALAVALTRRRQRGWRDPIAFTPGFITQFYAWCEQQPVVVSFGGAVLTFLAAFGGGAIFSNDLPRVIGIALAIAIANALRRRRAVTTA